MSEMLEAFLDYALTTSDLFLLLLTLPALSTNWLRKANRDSSFHCLKEALASAPVLAYPESEDPFVLDTDASNVGIASVSSPPRERKSHSLLQPGYKSKPECNYCTTRRELLAIVKAIDHFRPYLYGQKFTIRTNHASLQWLINFKNPEGQIARWLDKLQTYDFCIVYQERPPQCWCFVVSAMLWHQLRALSEPRGKRCDRKCNQHAKWMCGKCYSSPHVWRPSI